MSTADQLLQSFDRGVAIPDARVFRMRPLPTALRLVSYGAFGVACSWAAVVIGPHLNRPVPWGVYVAGAILVLLVAQALRLAISAAIDLDNRQGSVLIVTPTLVVRRRRKKVRSWSLAEFPGVTFILGSQRSVKPISVNRADGPATRAVVDDKLMRGSVTSIYLNHAGTTFDDELIDDASFGPMSEILRALTER